MISMSKLIYNNPVWYFVELIFQLKFMNYFTCSGVRVSEII